MNGRGMQQHAPLFLPVSFLGFFKTVAANSRNQQDRNRRNQQTVNFKNIGLLKAYTKL